MKKKNILGAAALTAALLVSTSPAPAQQELALSGLDIAMGKAMFDRLWTSAPASTDATDGLGPLFNARSCAMCHPRGERSSAVTGEDNKVIRSGVTAKLGDHLGNPDPVYGRQLQSNAVQGLRAEGVLVFDPADNPSAPYRIENLAYGPLASDTRVSGRIAPTLRGNGLLARIPETAIEALADPDDADGDGISGRVHWVADADGDRRMGRFGWKATAPGLAEQIGGALHFDLGLSSPINTRHEGDCTPAQQDCLDSPHGPSPRFDNLEVGPDALRVLIAFTASLRPKASSPDAPGKNIFNKIGCAACHIPVLALEDGTPVPAYTDLLLHDMGPMLDDGVKENDAESFEWRTAPLWGLGSVAKAKLGLLHDGRAKTISEAIRFHGGEASASTDAYRALSESDQAALIRFLEDL